MAKPIIDFQLSKMAMDGNWKMKPLRINLGTILLDNSVVLFDPGSYQDMEEDDKTRLD
jgi:hypothetical protein